MSKIDVLQICFLILIIIVASIVVAFLFHITPSQPDPTSHLVTSKNVTFVLSSVISKNSGFGGIGWTIEYFDNRGRGYYYLSQIFNNNFIITGDTYDIQYYRNENGDRQIYSFIDVTKDYAKCVDINGTCQ